MSLPIVFVVFVNVFFSSYHLFMVDVVTILSSDGGVGVLCLEGLYVRLCGRVVSCFESSPFCLMGLWGPDFIALRG